MKVLLKADNVGMFKMADEMAKMGDNFQKHVEIAMSQQLMVAVKAIQQSWLSHGGKQDFVYASVGFNTNMNADGSVSATVGVFKVDSIAQSFGRRTEKKSGKNGKIQNLQPSAAQVAWWHEFGTKSITQKNFLSSGFYASLAEQEKVFANAFMMSVSTEII
jgi:hypothetical protein